MPEAEPLESVPFSRQLQRLRLRAGLSQEQLAERAGLSQATIGALEQGRRQPHPHTAAMLAEALHVMDGDRVALLEAARGRQMAPARDGEAVPRIIAGDSAPGVEQWPVALTPLIGRESEIAQAAELLDPAIARTRLLTLVGPGGVGKTRLALAVAARLVHAYPDGIALVDLAPLRDARLVPATIARALSLQEAGGRGARELLLEHLAEQRVLLVLDNFEHVLGAAALVPELLRGCPGVAILVTSRTALRVQAERRFRVAPLATPTADGLATGHAIRDSAAVRLFVERAQAVAPEFALDETNAVDVARICRHLDGLPLSIELAAARVGLLQPGALLRRLERRLASLTSGAADLPERQQTLRDTLAWSYDLLTPSAQALFRRLGVFAGGWTLESAEAVCTDDDRSHGPDGVAAADLLDTMQALMDSSLVQRLEDGGGEARFGMLATLRDYAQEQLSASGEADATLGRLRDWAVAVVERVAPEWLDPAQVERLDHEQDNLRVALRWALQHVDVEAALRLGIGGWLLWYLRGRYGEGRAWLAEILRLPSAMASAALHVHALATAAHLANCEGDLMAAEALLREAEIEAEAAGDLNGAGLVAHQLANLARGRGELREAERLYTRALGLARQTRREGMRIMAGSLLAIVRFEQDDLAGASALLTEVLAACEVHDHPLARAWALSLSGRIAARAGDNAGAQQAFEASVQVMHELGNQQGLLYGEFYLGHAALDRGDRAEAATHLQEVLAVAEATRDEPMLARGLEAVARLLLPIDSRRGLSLVAAAGALRQRLGLPPASADRAGLERWLPDSQAAIDSAAGPPGVDVPTTAVAVITALDACASAARQPAAAPG